MKRFFILLATAALALASCSDNPDVLDLSTQEITVSAQGGEASFQIQANGHWTITTDGQTWYTLSQLSGEDDQTIKVTFDKYTDVGSRTAKLTVTMKDKIKTITLIINGPAVPKDPNAQKVSARRMSSTVQVAAPQDFTYKVTMPSGADWVSLVSQDDKTITFFVEENTTDDYRTAEIAVTTTNDQKLSTITLQQSWRNIEPGELLIEEVYFTATALESTGRPDKFHGDQYFRLTNNTDETLYADGIMIMEAKYPSTLHYTFLEPIRQDYCGVGTVYVIPGNGKEVPVEPGKSIIIANNAQNHKATNPNSFDLSNANFEWYDQSTSSSNQDVDNPNVPNLDIWFTYSLSVWVLHNRGFEGYAIALPPPGIDKDKFLADYAWTGQYTAATAAGEFTMNISKAYKVPNSWVIDAVNCTVGDLLFALSWDPSLDSGWTHCGTKDNDPDRFGHSVRRKKDTNGKLIDTNNSTNDFTPMATPSLKE